MYLPTPEQVTVAWLQTVAQVDPTKVATSLPADASVWGSTGFWQVTVVGGSLGLDTPLWAPVVAVDCWAAVPNSNRPPWGRAGSYAAAVLAGTYSARQVGALSFGEEFHPVRVTTCRPLSMPRRVQQDEAGFARVQLDIELTYIPEGVQA